MTENEIDGWRDLAALMDPDAYEWVKSTGTPTSRAVPAGKHWYLVNGWKLYELNGGTTPLWFHREADVRDEPMLLSAETLISTSTVSGSYMYLCKPELVTDPDADAYDSRYTSDPRGFVYERLAIIKGLDLFQVGLSSTSNSNVSGAFDSDFTDGLVTQVSCHDMAWIGLEETGAAAVLNLQDEISDTDRIRFATSALLPFKRATFPGCQARGASQSEGASVVTHVKLDGTGW